jgi:hypothetical protein
MAEEITFLKPKDRLTPNDEFKYLISNSVLSKTEEILNDYRNLKESSEGLVYWAGYRKNKLITILGIVAPKIKSGPQNLDVENKFYARVIDFLSDNKLVQIGQVHSHPSSWVDHSIYDDKGATSKVNGLISIVVPNYGSVGMRPLRKCGVHRFINGEFIRLSETYIDNHFTFTNQLKFVFGDYRNG